MYVIFLSKYLIVQFAAIYLLSLLFFWYTHLTVVVLHAMVIVLAVVSGVTGVAFLFDLSLRTDVAPSSKHSVEVQYNR